MKRFLLLFLLLLSSGLFAQSLNDYQYVIIPLRYDFMKIDNEYRLNTITKYNLEKMGFQAFYNDNNLPKEIAANSCSVLKVELEKGGSFIWTNMTIVFKDCQNNIVYQSEVGKSKEKDYGKAYTEALDLAFASVYKQNYSYQPIEEKTVETVVAPPKAVVASSVAISENSLKAIPIAGGFNLVDKMQKVVFKLTSTGKSDFYLAQKGTQSGVIFQKETEWFFEYNLEDKLMSEKVEIQF